MEARRHKWSRCRCALGLALLFDALGLAGLLVGGLLETAVSDLLIYLGGVAVFFSLPWWVFWHVGNLEVPLDELRDDVGLGWRSGGDAWSLESWRARRLALLARAFSAHFSLPSVSASLQSQAGRPRARFAAAAASGSPSSSDSLVLASQAEKAARAARSQEPGPEAALQRSSLLSSLPSSFLGSIKGRDRQASSISRASQAGGSSDAGPQSSSLLSSLPSFLGSVKGRDRAPEAALQSSSISRASQTETPQLTPQEQPSDVTLQRSSLLACLPDFLGSIKSRDRQASSISRPSQVGTPQRPSQSQDRPSEAALQRSSLLASLPSFLGSIKSRDRQASSISRRSQAGTPQGSSQSQEGATDAALQTPSLLSSLPSGSATTPQDSLGSVRFQDRGIQVSLTSLDATKWPKDDSPL